MYSARSHTYSRFCCPPKKIRERNPDPMLFPSRSGQRRNCVPSSSLRFLPFAASLSQHVGYPHEREDPHFPIFLSRSSSGGWFNRPYFVSGDDEHIFDYRAPSQDDYPLTFGATIPLESLSPRSGTPSPVFRYSDEGVATTASHLFHRKFR